MLHALATGRMTFFRALMEAAARLGDALTARRLLAVGRGGWVARQEEFFRRFRW